MVSHRKFGYRGVIFKVDHRYLGTQDWYDQMALSHPPKDRAWYHIMVHNSYYTTYVAERNLRLDERAKPIKHPMIHDFFTTFADGRYRKYVGADVNTAHN